MHPRAHLAHSFWRLHFSINLSLQALAEASRPKLKPPGLISTPGLQNRVLATRMHPRAHLAHSFWRLDFSRNLSLQVVYRIIANGEAADLETLLSVSSVQFSSVQLFKCTMEVLKRHQFEQHSWQQKPPDSNPPNLPQKPTHTTQPHNQLTQPTHTTHPTYPHNLPTQSTHTTYPHNLPKQSTHPT